MKDPPHVEGSQFVKDLPEKFNELGSFIREQRSSARLSLRRLSELAGISNPYLSQIERGLRRPSAEILQQIAKALRISAETLYVQAGILEKPNGDTDLSRHIFADHHLTEEQRQAMLRIYLSFRHENEGEVVDERAAPEASASGARESSDHPGRRTGGEPAAKRGSARAASSPATGTHAAHHNGNTPAGSGSATAAG